MLQVAGASLDVYPSEPPPPELKELVTHPKVVCSPHLGASTQDAQVRHGAVQLMRSRRRTTTIPAAGCLLLLLLFLGGGGGGCCCRRVYVVVLLCV